MTRKIIGLFLILALTVCCCSCEGCSSHGETPSAGAAGEDCH